MSLARSRRCGFAHVLSASLSDLCLTCSSAWRCLQFEFDGLQLFLEQLILTRDLRGNALALDEAETAHGGQGARAVRSVRVKRV